MNNSKPEILAPAGDLNSALAALAAGADAVYLGLKHFSARMQAENFSMASLARLTTLAHQEGRRVYVALNSLLKPSDPIFAGKLMARLERDASPDALIVQDPGALELARQAGFSGELHLSTLANVTHPLALRAAQRAGARRVILPRELSLDEVLACCEACPPGLALELFVHGALCYCVSGRCYWSSYMGGKSGLRGRCVQPCRRVYRQKGRGGRFFSCLDLSLDELVRRLLPAPNLASWKIEGRKKGPHYVYHTVQAYRLLRDRPDDPQAVKEAQRLLAHALGRPRTRAGFLPQAAKAPVDPGRRTGSGSFAGKITVQAKGRARYALKPGLALLPGDLLRIGYEDEPWHFVLPVSKPVGRGGYLAIRPPAQKAPKPGSEVFVIDRQSPELASSLASWGKKLAAVKPRGSKPSGFSYTPPPPAKPRPAVEMVLGRNLAPGGRGEKGGRQRRAEGLWLTQRMLHAVSRGIFGRVHWWLPPVIWPDEEAAWRNIIGQTLRRGGRSFVLGAPWQVEFFQGQKAELTAGPFCNPSNPAELSVYQEMGINAAIISPELSVKDVLALPGQSPLPLGVVLSGYWPMGITRHSLEGVRANEPFTSPKGEVFWARKYGQNTWIMPGWPLDITDQRARLTDAGYSLFVTLADRLPKKVPQAKRASRFNWELTLL